MYPKISIIIPVFNVSLYLSKCLESVHRQSYENLEIIVVNDGSTDGSDLICTDFEKKDKRVRVINQQNLGLGCARNTGLEVMTGEFVSFIDGDDFVDEDFIQKLFSGCQSSGVNIAICGRSYVENEQMTPLFSRLTHTVWDVQVVMNKLLVWDGLDGSVCDKLFNVKLFKGVRFHVGTVSEDLPVFVKLLLKSEKVVHIGEQLYFYTVRVDSLSNNVFNREKMTILDSVSAVIKLLPADMDIPQTKKNYFYFKHVLDLTFGIYKTFDRTSYENELSKLMRIIGNNLFKVVFNPYLPFSTRIKSILLLTNTYTLVQKLKRIIGRIFKTLGLLGKDHLPNLGRQEKTNGIQ